MIYLNGISSQFDYESLDNTEILSLWFKELDRIYFHNEKVIIELNKNDREIIKLSKECFEKLQVISFKKNVLIKNM